MNNSNEMKGLFNLNWANVKSAIVYGILTLAATFMLAALQDILNTGSIFGLNWRALIDKSIIATIPVLIVLVSLAKNLLTTKKGEFLGVTEVIPDKK